jgi:predicted nucleotidyltransferase
VHNASIDEVVARFGKGGDQREAVTKTLMRIYNLVAATGYLDRFIIFGSYVTNKPEPNDVDIFLVMAEEFDVDKQTGDTRKLFSHTQAQASFGASVFWVNRSTSFASIEDLIDGWQTKRDLSQRGIIEVIA